MNQNLYTWRLSRQETCPTKWYTNLNGIQIPQVNEAKNTWDSIQIDDSLGKNISLLKGKQWMLRKFYWLMCRNSQLSLENKLLLYKCTIISIWTYGVQLWDTTVNFIEIFQAKIFWMITNSQWYITIDSTMISTFLFKSKKKLKSKSNYTKFKPIVMHHN